VPSTAKARTAEPVTGSGGAVGTAPSRRASSHTSTTASTAEVGATTLRTAEAPNTGSRASAIGRHGVPNEMNFAALDSWS